MIVLVWLHLVAAVSWIGGMAFLSLVLVPVLMGTPATPERQALFHAVARRFRVVVWSAVVVLVTTGLVLVQTHIESWRPGGWPATLQVKLSLVAALIGLTALHDFWLGPRAGRARTADGSDRPQARGGSARWIARVTVLLALTVLLAAVALVRL